MPHRLNTLQRLMLTVVGFSFALSLTAAIGAQFVWAMAAVRTPFMLLGLGGDKAGVKLSVAWPASPSPLIDAIYGPYDGDAPYPRLEDIFIPENFSFVSFANLGVFIDRRWTIPGPGGSLTIGLHYAWLISISAILGLFVLWLTHHRLFRIGDLR